jgi:hypothetical protein
MNGILGMAQVLAKPQLDDRRRLASVRVLANSGQALMTLLNDILDLSKVEAGKFTLHPVDVSVAELVQETADLFAQAAANKGLRLTVQVDLPTAARHRLDPVRLRQMLSNLVSNAIKFTDAGEIGIEVAADPTSPGRPGTLTFAVRDTGIGVPPDKQGLLFQSFSQVDGSSTRAHGGTGLGLSIVRQLARLMRGEAGAESTPGQGSRFWFRVPAALQDGAGAGAGGPAADAVVAASAAASSAAPLAAPLPASGMATPSILARSGGADSSVQATVGRPLGRPVDCSRVKPLLERLLPLLQEHLFDAMEPFHDLQLAVAGTDAQPRIDALADAMAALDFDRVHAGLSDWALTLAPGSAKPPSSDAVAPDLN